MENFRASIDLAQPHRSSADGTLRIEGLDLREYADMPVTMDRLNVDATGRTLRVHDSVLRLAGERLAVSGTVEGGGERLVVDARIARTRLTPRALLREFSRDRPDKTAASGAWNFPVEGRVAIAATSLAYGSHVFKPMNAGVRIAPNRVIVDAPDTAAVRHRDSVHRHPDSGQRGRQRAGHGTQPGAGGYGAVPVG